MFNLLNISWLYFISILHGGSTYKFSYILI